MMIIQHQLLLTLYYLDNVYHLVAMTPPSFFFFWPFKYGNLFLNQDYTRALHGETSLLLAVVITCHITFSSIVNVNADTLNLHRLIFLVKYHYIACFHCLHCFRECNFQTLDMPDVMTSGNKTTIYMYLSLSFITDLIEGATAHTNGICNKVPIWNEMPCISIWSWFFLLKHLLQEPMLKPLRGADPFA